MDAAAAILRSQPPQGQQPATLDPRASARRASGAHGACAAGAGGACGWRWQSQASSVEGAGRRGDLSRENWSTGNKVRPADGGLVSRNMWRMIYGQIHANPLTT